MRIVGAFMIWVLLSSCATILNRKTYNLKINSGGNHDKIEIGKKEYALPAIVKVERSRSDLQIKYISDSTVYDYRVRSSPNPAFVYGNLWWMTASPAAYLIDLTNEKRFYYGHYIFLDKSDTSRIITPGIRGNFAQRFPKRKGQWDLILSLPHINSFFLKPNGEGDKVNTGFLGLSMGLEYFYKNNRYLSLSANAVSDFFLPVPAAVDNWGEYELMTSSWISLTQNYKMNRFRLGYGINYSMNTWDLQYDEPPGGIPPTRAPETKSTKSLGLTFNVYHQVKRNFFIGLIYRPTLIRTFPAVEFKYEHLFSVDFGWRIPLKK